MASYCRQCNHRTHITKMKDAQSGKMINVAVHVVRQKVNSKWQKTATVGCNHVEAINGQFIKCNCKRAVL